MQSDATNGSVAVCYKCISIVSYNTHGYNEDAPTVRGLTLSTKRDVFVLQDHWLTPPKLSMFENDFPQLMCFGSSAMSSCVESGVVRGRSFGGVMNLVNKRLSLCSRIICASDRYVIVTVGNLLIVNVYLPCSGTANTIAVLQEIINNLLPWLQAYPNHTSMPLPCM